MAIDVNSKNSTFEFKRIYQISMTTSGWKLGEDDTLALRVTDASGAERKAEFGTAVNWGKTDISCLFVVGDTVSVTATPIAEVHPNFNAATASKTPTMNDSLSLTCKKFVAVKVTAPEGSTIDAGTLTKYYVFSFMKPITLTTETSSGETAKKSMTATFHFDENTDYFCRVRHPQGATYWNYVRLTADAAYTVTDEDLGLTGDFNKSTIYHFENNVHDRAGIYLNINTKGYKNMSVGDTFELNSFRNWFAIESYMNSKVALPEMHYQVIDVSSNPSDVVTITPDALNSNVTVMEAKKEGTAIVLVTYDAMTHMNGQTSTASHRFSAIWPELTGVFVVTVGADDSWPTMNTKSDGKRTYTITVEYGVVKSGDASVSSVTVAGVEAQAGADNRYTVTLPYGTNVTADSFVIVPHHPGASVDTLAQNGTVWSFTVTAEDGIVSAVYTVAVATMLPPYIGSATGGKKPDTDVRLPFTDVSRTSWFYADAAFVYEKGLFSGTDSSTFSPDASMTRAMLVTVLYRLEGQPAVTGSSSFADVKSGVYYERAVIWAAANGIVTGTGSASFSPDAKVTREQLAAILYRYAQYRKLDTSANAKLNGFSDADNVSGYASAALGWAVAEGLVNGASGRLMPKGNATRAQVAAIFHRFVESVMNRYIPICSTGLPRKGQPCRCISEKQHMRS